MSLIHKSAAFKRYLTEFNNYLHLINSQELTSTAIEELNARLEKLETKFESNETVQEEIYEDDPENFEKHLDEATEIENLF